MRLVLFDCDGTIADSFGIIVATMRATFEAAGLPAPAEAATHGVIGLSLAEAIDRLRPGASSDEIEALVEAYRTNFHRMRNDPGMDEALFPGMEALVRDLAARPDVVVGLVTGKSRRGVRLILERHSLEGIFSAVRTADDCPSKPHPAMVEECCRELGVPESDTVVVGDAVFDMAMARAAGAGAIGVAWGASAQATLREAGASAVASDAAELSTLLGRWLGSPENAALSRDSATRGAIG